jgi:hypothetical protein
MNYIFLSPFLDPSYTFLSLVFMMVLKIRWKALKPNYYFDAFLPFTTTYIQKIGLVRQFSI